MWLFKRRNTSHPTSLAIVMLPGGKRIDVVGESFYQANIERIAGGKKRESANLSVTAALICEPQNLKDKNAVAVYVNGLQVGYLARPDAKRLRPMIERMAKGGDTAGCQAVITGGWRRKSGDEGHFGVFLDLDR